MDGEEVEVHKRPKKERGQYQAVLTEQLGQQRIYYMGKEPYSLSGHCG